MCNFIYFKDPYSWLKQPMISKKESSHFVQMNVERYKFILTFNLCAYI